MQLASEDIFHDPYLGFSVQKPSSWRFLPPAWSPTAQMKNSADLPDDWIHYAKLPFCCAMDHHASTEHAYSTLQVTARPFAVPSNHSAAGILRAQIDFLAEQHLDFELIDSTSEAIIGGHRANLIRASYCLMTQLPGCDPVEFSVLSRSALVFAPGRAYTIGLSSSADERNFNEADFSAIVSSVRIGTKLFIQAEQ